MRFWTGLPAAPAEQATPPATAPGVIVRPGVVIRSPVQEIGAAEESVPRRRGGRPSHAAFSSLARRLRPGRVASGRVTLAPPATSGRLVGRRPRTTPGTAVGVNVTRPGGLLTGGCGPPAPPGARCWLHIVRPAAIRSGPGLATWIVLPAAYPYPPAVFLPRLVRSARGGRRVTAAALAWVCVRFLTRGYLARRGGPAVTGHFAWGGGASVAGGPVARCTGTSVIIGRPAGPAGR
jgi:hypothetical protein